MKYLKPINILYELGIWCLSWITILPITMLLTPRELMIWFDVPFVILIILCLILIASITIRGIRKYPERIIFSNFLFGLIVGTLFMLIVFGSLVPGGLVGLFRVSIDAIIFTLGSYFTIGVIVGFVAVLWGGIIQLLIKLHKKKII